MPVVLNYAVANAEDAIIWSSDKIGGLSQIAV